MGPPGLPGPPGYPGQKGEKGEKGESVSVPAGLLKLDGQNLLTLYFLSIRRRHERLEVFEWLSL